MEVQIDKGRGDVFDRLEAHVIGRGGQEPVEHFLRDRFAGFGVDGEFGEDFRHFQPVFVKLAGQFDEIAGHGRARDPFVGDIGQHLVKRVAEFVKERARVVIGQ